jgi:transposase-like protein
VRESTQSWREFLIKLQNRGMNADLPPRLPHS